MITMTITMMTIMTIDHDDHETIMMITMSREGPSLNMDLETTTFDLKYIFPKTEKLELVFGTNILVAN